MIDLAAFAPDPWRGPADYAPNSDLALDGDFLSEDFCVMGGRYFFVRSVLQIPLRDNATSFGFGTWCTLSRDNFEDYIARFDAADYAGVGPWPSYLCNDLLGLVGAKPLAGHLFAQLDRQRPVFRIDDPDHPLAAMQREGIDGDGLLAIYRHYGHAPG